MIRILIVDDTRIYREGLASTLAGWDAVAGVTTASTRAAARCAAAELGPDVVLINLASVGALETVRQILGSCPGTRVVALRTGEDDEELVACAEAGVTAYLWREGSVEDLERVVSTVLRDDMPCSPRIASVLRERAASAVTGRARRADPAAPFARLTPREAEIVRMLEEGCSNKEIARRLNITALTVKNHVHHVLEKLNVRRRGQVAAAARALSRQARPSALD